MRRYLTRAYGGRMRVTIQFERPWSGVIIDETTQGDSPFQGRYDLLRALEQLVEPSADAAAGTASGVAADPD